MELALSRADAPPEAEDDAVVLADVSRRFAAGRHPVQALSRVHLRVPAGAVYALVGRSGAGKTTLLRTVLGMLRPDAGRVSVLGLDAAREGAAVRARAGFVPAGDDHPQGRLPAEALLRLHAGYYPGWDEGYSRSLARRFELSLRQRFAHLSRGQRKLVQLVMALGHRPELLVLDEPLEAIDPVQREVVRGVLAEHLAGTPATMLVATHDLAQLSTLVTHVGVLRQGRAVRETAVDELQRRLRSYQIAAPPGWSLPGAVEGRMAGGEPGSPRLVLWGEEPEIDSEITASGAAVSRSRALTLDEIVRALLA
jgi:ABC-2 type transport system ATP-binding protein